MYVSESEILKVQKYENEIVNDTMCVNLLCSCIHKVWIAVNAGWTKARSSPATRSPTIIIIDIKRKNQHHHHCYSNHFQIPDPLIIIIIITTIITISRRSVYGALAFGQLIFLKPQMTHMYIIDPPRPSLDIPKSYKRAKPTKHKSLRTL